MSSPLYGRGVTGSAPSGRCRCPCVRGVGCPTAWRSGALPACVPEARSLRPQGGVGPGSVLGVRHGNGRVYRIEQRPLTGVVPIPGTEASLTVVNKSPVRHDVRITDNADRTLTVRQISPARVAILGSDGRTVAAFSVAVHHRSPHRRQWYPGRPDRRRVPLCNGQHFPWERRRTRAVRNRASVRTLTAPGRPSRRHAPSPRHPHKARPLMPTSRTGTARTPTQSPTRPT